MHQHCPPASLVRAGQKGFTISESHGSLWDKRGSMELVPQFLKGKETMGTKKVPGGTRKLCGTLGL